LELDACRYNGQSIRAPFVKKLLPFVDVTPTCPEVEIGLGVPRDPIRLVSSREQIRLVQPSTQRDLTDLMHAFSDRFLGEAGDVDGFILKSRSPSCGIKDTKVHSSGETPQPIGRGPGMFGEAVLERFPRAAVEDEGRLTNFRLRHHFLTQLYANARLREARARGTARALVDYHTRHKFLLMACHQDATRALGRIVANPAKNDIDGWFAGYAEEMARALARPARTGATVNALMHVFGYVSDDLTAKEKAHFLDVLVEFREGRLELHAPLSILQSWIARFEQPYLEAQVFLEPYPKPLLDQRDSARGV
jgi:uncharacterized protein YbgA (DUF1722 family)/uncharacterized protein YbbK (DUF523 family)